LAGRCDLAQQQISMFEAGQRLPTLEQFLGLARALDVPLQRLMSGADRPGKSVRDIAIELRSFGVTDLRVKDAPVPGAFRRAEEVVALAVSDRAPDPRIIEAMPAVLAWAEMSWTLLKAYGIITGTTWRLAWLADVTLLIEKKGGFPGGCRKGVLEQFLKAVALPPEGADWDSLGRPSSGLPSLPLWRRWKINYDASVDHFAGRAASLATLGGGLEQPLRIALQVAQSIADDMSAAPKPASVVPKPASLASAKLRLMLRRHKHKKKAPKPVPKKGRADGQ
jgi:transcriptional regulator with XRE-family HTH domain